MQPVDQTAVASFYAQLLEAWNRQSADDFASCFDEDGSTVGFDGSPTDGRARIASTLRDIFARHRTAAYIAKIREIRRLAPDIVLLRAVVGMVPAGKTEIKRDVNAIQSLVIGDRDGQLRVILLQNTPAAFHGHPELGEQLTKELTGVLRSGHVVSAA